VNKAQQYQTTLFSLLVSSVFIFSVFYSQQSPGGEGLRIPYNNWVWIFAIITICAAVFQIILKREIVLPKYWLALAALPLGMILSGFIIDTTKPTQWLFKMGYVSAGYGFLIGLFQFHFKRRHIETILYTLCMAATIHSLIGATQILGWHFSSYIPRTLENAPISFFQQINVHASFLITAFFTACYLATSPSIKQRAITYKLIILLTILTTTTTLLAIGSRTTLVVFTVSAPLMLIARYSLFKKYRNFSLFLAVTFLIGLAAGSFLSDGLAKYETKLDTQRSHARTYIYDLSWQIFKQQPLLGHGLGSFEKVFQEAKTDYPHSDKMGGQRYSHPHNEMLLWMIESGVLSIIGIFIALISTLFMLFGLGWRRAGAYLALIFPISFHTQVELPFYLSSALWFLWLSLLYIIHSHSTTVHRVNLSRASQRLTITASIVISSLLIGFFIHALVSLTGIVKYISEKNTDFSKLSAAHSNIYYQDLAQNITLSTLLYADISTSEQNYTQLYINWAEQHLISYPVTSVYTDLALAYYYIGKKQQALELIRKAAQIYPATVSITQRLQEIELNLDISEFKQKIKTGVKHSQGLATP
jgi:O-antigen polymerase